LLEVHDAYLFPRFAGNLPPGRNGSVNSAARNVSGPLVKLRSASPPRIACENQTECRFKKTSGL
jgi:hypothetical protein